MSIAQNTHPSISEHFVGRIDKLNDGEAWAHLLATEEMLADEHGLIHGGFTFGLADFAAMLAVNDPNVVLGAAHCKFLAPVQLGARMEAHARIDDQKNKKRTVTVTVSVDSKNVFEGEFTCFVLEQHILNDSA
jgi:acyl-coenzyme A thioesterase PaaI-like protein